MLGLGCPRRRVRPGRPPARAALPAAVAAQAAQRETRFELGLLRVGVLLVTATLLFQTTKFNEPGNLWRKAYEIRGEHWRYWNQKTNYRSNGFGGGFLYNMPISAMAKPPGYDQDRHGAGRRALHRRPRSSINRSRTGSLDDVNVVLVLSESFTDPTRLDGFDLERDPIPQTRATMGETDVGHDAGAAVRRRHGQHGVRDADRSVDRAVPAADGLALPDARLRLRELSVGGRVVQVAGPQGDRDPPLHGGPLQARAGLPDVRL